MVECAEMLNIGYCQRSALEVEGPLEGTFWQ